MKIVAALLLPLALLAFAPIQADACPGCGEHGAIVEDKGDKTTKEGTKPEGEVKEVKKEEAEPENATVDKKAPAFALKNAKGEEIKLADYSGKIVVLEWINFDCPIVKKHYQNGTMTKLAKKYRDEGVVWLQICSSSTGTQGHFEGEALTNRIEKEGSDAKFYLIDEDGTVGKKYQAKTTPHMYVIDKEGKLRYQGAIDSSKNGGPVGDDGTNYVSEALTAVKDGKEVATKETKPYGCNVKYARGEKPNRKGAN